MNIVKDITQWDGKSAGDIQKIYDKHHRRTDFSDEIIKLTLNPTYEKGATWLLKAWLESGYTLSKTQIKRIYGLLEQLENWEAKLHVLQCIHFMPIERAEKKQVYSFLRQSIIDSNKFVRAWAYNGLYELSQQHSKYLAETKEFFEMAMRDEAASVKARIRMIVKKGF